MFAARDAVAVPFVLLLALPAVAQVSWTRHDLLGRVTDPVAFDAGRGRLVLFTRSSGQPALPETWEWDSTAWQRQRPAARPTIPTTTSLAGALVYGQVAVLDPGANAFGAVTSNGLSLQVGSR